MRFTNALFVANKVGKTKRVAGAELAVPLLESGHIIEHLLEPCARIEAMVVAARAPGAAGLASHVARTEAEVGRDRLRRPALSTVRAGTHRQYVLQFRHPRSIPSLPRSGPRRIRPAELDRPAAAAPARVPHLWPAGSTPRTYCHNGRG